MHKLKVLALAENCNSLVGHAAHQIGILPIDKYDVNLIVKKDLEDSCQERNLFKRLYLRIKKSVKYRLHIQKEIKISPNNKYCFFGLTEKKFSAKDILNKYGQKPDIIMLFWYDKFITTQIIADLYKYTKAYIVFIFVDQFPLTGFCHYPCECTGYQKKCNACPAILSHKKEAIQQQKRHKKRLINIPKAIIATKADCEMANLSLIFKNSPQFEWTYIPPITLNTTKEEARKKLGLPTNTFIIMYGMAYIHEERKGFKYFIEALKFLSSSKKTINKTIIAYIPGNISTDATISLNDINCYYPGRLSLDDLYVAYKAADIFISTSIADSGPMMVNNSIACGTPVISFNIGIAKTLVKHKQTGYIADFKSAFSIFKGLMFFLQMPPSQYLKYQKRCLKLAKKYQTINSPYDNLYNYVINSHLKM